MLPVESIFGIEVEPRGRVVHVDRIAVDRSRRHRESRVLLGLLMQCWLEMRRRGYHVWAGIESAGMVRLLRRLGFEMTILGPPRHYWGEDRVPIRFDPVAVADAICNRLGNAGES
jgi:N-acyl-L-homoserine lactone synthetase